MFCCSDADGCDTKGDVVLCINKDLVPKPKPKHFLAYFKTRFPTWTELVVKKDLQLTLDLLKFDKIMVRVRERARQRETERDISANLLSQCRSAE
jgi:hypothetical protein